MHLEAEARIAICRMGKKIWVHHLLIGISINPRLSTPTSIRPVPLTILALKTSETLASQPTYKY